MDNPSRSRFFIYDNKHIKGFRDVKRQLSPINGENVTLRYSPYLNAKAASIDVIAAEISNAIDLRPVRRFGTLPLCCHNGSNK